MRERETTPADRIRKRIEKYKESGHWDKVVREYKALISFYPVDADLHRALGEALQNANQGLAAVTEFMTAARYYEESGQIDKTVAVLKKVLRLKPTLMDIRLRLADIYAKAGKSQEAVEHYQDVNRYFMELGAIEEAIGVYKKLVELQPNNVILHLKLAEMYHTNDLKAQAAEEYKKLARKFRNNGILSEELNVLMNLLKIEPENAPALLRIARIHFHYARFQDAIDFVQRIMTTHQNYAEAFLLLGDILTELKENEKAVKAYIKYIALKPNDQDMREKVVTLLIEMGNYNLAIKEAVQLIPFLIEKGSKERAKEFIDIFCNHQTSDITFWENLVMSMRHLGKTDVFVEKVRNLSIMYKQRGMMEKAGKLEAFIENAAQLTQKEREVTVIKDMKIFAEPDPEEDTLHRIGRSVQDQFEREKQELYDTEDILKKDPGKRRKSKFGSDTAKLGLNVGKALFNLELYDEAIEEFKSLLLNQQLSDHAHGWLGLCFLKKGNADAARKLYDKIQDEELRRNFIEGNIQDGK